MSDEKVPPSEAQSAAAASAPARSGDHIPRWTKALASFSAAVIVLGLVSGTAFVVWFRQAAMDAFNPVYMIATLKLIGDFPLPANLSSALPADTKSAQDALTALTGGYLPVYAFRAAGLDGVNFSQGKDKQQFVIIGFQGPESDPDRRDVIDYCYDNPAIFFSEWGGKYISVADKAKADINGRQFEYQTGLLKDLKGVNHKSLIGCLNHGRKVVVVEAVAAVDQPINVEEVLTFLRKAQSF